MNKWMPLIDCKLDMCLVHSQCWGLWETSLHEILKQWMEKNCDNKNSSAFLRNAVSVFARVLSHIYKNLRELKAPSAAEDLLSLGRMPFKGLKATQKANICKTKVVLPFSSELISFILSTHDFVPGCNTGSVLLASYFPYHKLPHQTLMIKTRKNQLP